MKNLFLSIFLFVVLFITGCTKQPAVKEKTYSEPKERSQKEEIYIA